MPILVDRKGPGYTNGSTESSSEPDESWSPISPLARGKKRESTDKLATPRPKDDSQHGNQSTMSGSSQTLSSVSTSSSRPKQNDMQYKPATESISSARSSSRTASTMTPSKGKGKAEGTTPASRKAAMREYLSARSASRNPKPSPTKPPQATEPPPPIKVIVIDDSTDEDSTDTESWHSSVDLPTFPKQRKPVPNDSSFSSVDGIFSPVSATSSFSSVGSSASFAAPGIAKSKSGASSTSVPVVINDMFSSMNISGPRNQRGPSVISSSASLPPPTTVTSTNGSDSRAISKFANSSFGVDLEECIIAHDNKTQAQMDAYDIAWGTQYELARGVSDGSWTWNDVVQNLNKLRNENAYSANADIAWKVRSIMKGRDPESGKPADLSIWKELDREQMAICENKSRGLGLMGEWQGVQNWYGGKIQQVVRLVKEENTLKVLIEPLEMRKSHRFARFYGSRRFLHLRMSEDLLKNENERIKAFLLKKFILCGRVFVPFHSKEEAVYMVETNENYNRSSRKSSVLSSDHLRLSFQKFINWHNPLDVPKNYKQVISKYAARFALGLSNSIPVLEIKEKNIFFIPDITTDDWPSHKSNPPADKLMTDGCGFLNHAALLQIVKIMGYESLPAGVQGRFDGSKGFWILHPHDDSPEPKIWIRDSQNKIKNRSFDKAHKIFDLLEPSRPSSSVSITAQSIINLFHNGLPREMLARMMEEGLEEEIAPLLNWNAPNAMVFLWNVINKLGNVSGSRTQRLAMSLNRALGLKGRDWGREDDGDPDKEEPIDEDDILGYTGRSQYSSAPLSLQESALEMIQAGFHPASNYQLHQKISYIVQSTIATSVNKYRIPVNESFGAFIVPDPLGVLEEGEIYYKFSKPRKDPKTEMLIHTLQGEVVLGRYPIRLPSDMQKVMAVDRRELDKWPDVVIVSVKGKRSVASLLADGDMDGDELIVIFNPEIVSKIDCKPFTNAPDNFLEDNFEASSRVETVKDFCIRIDLFSPRETSEAFLEHLISNLTQSQVGLYSMMHEVSTITQGYDNSESVRLAYIFATLLDSSKTGHRLKPIVFQRDIRTYPKSAIKSEDPDMTSRDILHYLSTTASNKGHELLARFQKSELKFFSQHKMGRYTKGLLGSYSKIMEEFKDDREPDLVLPYTRANDFAMNVYHRTKSTVFTEELSKIRNQVDAAYAKFCELCKTKKGQAQDSPVKASSKKSKKIIRVEPMVESLKIYAQPIPDISLTPNVEQVKAAYAYSISAAFGYTMAFRELCSIKASASPGGLAPSTRIFDEGKSFPPSFLRALKLSHED